VCEVGTGFSVHLYYCFVKPRCILFPSLNTVIMCKSVLENVYGNCGVAKECCVFLRGFKMNILGVYFVI